MQNEFTMSMTQFVPASRSIGAGMEALMLDVVSANFRIPKGICPRPILVQLFCPVSSVAS